MIFHRLLFLLVTCWRGTFSLFCGSKGVEVRDKYLGVLD